MTRVTSRAFSLHAYLLGTVSLFAVSAGISTPASANPDGPAVTAGQAEFSTPTPSTLQVDQASDKAIIDWQSFDIDAGETTVFVQPNVDAVALNRVVGNDPSEILGSLQANGRIFLVNRNGILFGTDAQVDVAGLVATTHDISNENFLAGNYVFDIPGSESARVVNLGQVSIADQGLAAFVAPSVRNDGVVVAKLGKVAMGAANGFTLDLHGDELIKLFVDDPVSQEIYDTEGNRVESLVENHGRIEADGGHVLLTAAGARQAVDSVINHDGVIQANTVSSQNGEIVLSAGAGGALSVSGEVSARGDDAEEAGGYIEVTGDHLALLEDGKLDASGNAGGGTILFGGDYKGGNGAPKTIETYDIQLEKKEIPTAVTSILGPDTSVSADALSEGDGGKIIVWSDQVTATAADISAKGGRFGGDGGFIETSGATLHVEASADASAPMGTPGTWLLDPLNIDIDDVDSEDVDYFVGFLITALDGTDLYGIDLFPTGENAVVDVDSIETALNNSTYVFVDTRFSSGNQSGEIRVKADITKSSPGYGRLTLWAMDDVIIDEGVDIRALPGTGPFDFELIAQGGRIDADDIGRVELNDGRFLLLARDGIDISSPYDMPRIWITANLWESPRSSVPINIEFGEDVVDVSYDNQFFYLRSDAIQLVESLSSGVEFSIYGGLSEVYEDRAILGRPGRYYGIYTTGDAAVFASDSLNGVPEVIGFNSYDYWLRTSEPPSYLTPVLEVSYDEGITADDLIPTSPQGVALVNALNNSVPIESVVQQTENPVSAETDINAEQASFGSLNIYDIFDVDIYDSVLSDREIKLLRSLGVEKATYYDEYFKTSFGSEKFSGPLAKYVEMPAREFAGLVANVLAGDSTDTTLKDAFRSIPAILEMAAEYRKIAFADDSVDPDRAHEWAAFRFGYELGDPSLVAFVRLVGEIMQYHQYGVLQYPGIGIVVDGVQLLTGKDIEAYNILSTTYFGDANHDVSVTMNGARFRESGMVIDPINGKPLEGRPSLSLR